MQSITQMARKIEDLVPGAKVGVGHGQMPAAELEKVMMDFIYGEYNVLVATTIIESGIDIPNANTIIINNAQNFGLSDLHQLRGRVGRTNRKAYCYLLVPSQEGISTDSQRRLRAIEEFSDLGSGFNIAMQDLDIRGAGNILGAEQSGFMADIGYETYQKIVSEAMVELHDELGSESGIVLPDNITTIDCTVETDTSAHLPDSYIGSTSEKIRLYRALDAIKDLQTLEEFKERLVDRFGELPSEAEELLEVVQLRGDASRLGFDKVMIKGQRAVLNFAYSPQSSYYSGELFGLIMSHVARNPRHFRMRQGAKLSLEVVGVGSISSLRDMLRIRG
ncbi:MAG: TRCF domain-containing protein [Rikenellaceae bacterium]